MGLINQLDVENLYVGIRNILANARQRAYSAVNFAMVESYWLIGQQIVEYEQHGEARADYGKGLLKELAAKLSVEFGKGFAESNLRYMRLFYRCFPIRDTLRPELTWSHYRRLISVENEQARIWYINEAADRPCDRMEQGWLNRYRELPDVVRHIIGQKEIDKYYTNNYNYS